MTLAEGLYGDAVLSQLSQTLRERRSADPAGSYTARLFADGPDAILKKIGEEAAELIIAGKAGAHKDIVWEAADVLFHLTALLAFYGLSADDVLQEIHRREGTSGLAVKKAREKAHGRHVEEERK